MNGRLGGVLVAEEWPEDRSKRGAAFMHTRLLLWGRCLHRSLISASARTSDGARCSPWAARLAALDRFLLRWGRAMSRRGGQTACMPSAKASAPGRRLPNRFRSNTGAGRF